MLFESNFWTGVNSQLFLNQNHIQIGKLLIDVWKCYREGKDTFGEVDYEFHFKQLSTFLRFLFLLKLNLLFYCIKEVCSRPM